MCTPPSQFNVILALVLAAAWGTLWAGVLQWTYAGRFLAARSTWVTVVVGIGVDLLIALLAPVWVWIVAVISVSSIPIIMRSLLNEARDNQMLLRYKADRETGREDEDEDSE